MALIVTHWPVRHEPNHEPNYEPDYEPDKEQA